MDKLAPAIQWIKKNGFWLASGFLTLLMIGIWFMTTGTIDDQTSKGESAIKSSVSSADAIMKKSAEEGVKAHPNQSTEDGMKREMEATINAIVAAWEKREADQKAILVWPKVIPNERFAQVFERFNPPETFNEELQKESGLDPLLELYRLRIPDHMNYLCGDDLLRTRWKYDPKYALEAAEAEDDRDSGIGFGGGPGGMSGGPKLDYDPNDYAVLWSDLNQDLWYNKMTQFQGRDDQNLATNTPTPLQCYMLQQDLWLLEAMFKILRKINGNAAANDLAKIKTIDHVAFGRLAGKDLGKLTPPDMRLAKNGDAESGGQSILGMDSYEEEDYGGDEDENYSGGSFGINDAFVGRVPYDERYVDVNFQPLAAEVVKGVVTGTELPTENLELLVAKRVPVRIALRMDERSIPDFMAECANSEFAFEIQQVRWNRHKPGGGDIVDNAPASGPGGLGGRGGGLAFGSGSSSATTLHSSPIETRTSYDVNVEFFGIVKIYNPVRENLLRAAAGLELKGGPVNSSVATEANP